MPNVKKLFFSHSQYDPKSRYTFAEVVKKLTLLLDNSGSMVVMNTSTTNSINSSNSSLNGISAGISSPLNRNGYNKRNSMDSTLNNSQVPINRVLNQSISESPQKYQQLQQSQELSSSSSSLAHRRSLSEHVIMSSMPADKARCHILNRANSKLHQEQPTSPPTSPTIPIYSNVTLRKVAETMFLKDPQYKPRPKEDSKLNPFAALTQVSLDYFLLTHNSNENFSSTNSFEG